MKNCPRCNKRFKWTRKECYECKVKWIQVENEVFGFSNDTKSAIGLVGVTSYNKKWYWSLGYRKSDSFSVFSGEYDPHIGGIAGSKLEAMREIVKRGGDKFYWSTGIAQMYIDEEVKKNRRSEIDDKPVGYLYELSRLSPLDPKFSDTPIPIIKKTKKRIYIRENNGSFPNDHLTVLDRSELESQGYTGYLPSKRKWYSSIFFTKEAKEKFEQSK